MEIRPETHFNKELHDYLDREVANETKEAMIEEYAKTLMEFGNECDPHLFYHLREAFNETKDNNYLELGSSMDCVIKYPDAKKSHLARTGERVMNIAYEYWHKQAMAISRKHFSHE